MYIACVQPDYNMTQIYALSRSFSRLCGLSYTALNCLITLQTAVTDACAPDQWKKRFAGFWKTKESRIHLGQGETCHEKLVEFIRSLKRCKLIWCYSAAKLWSYKICIPQQLVTLSSSSTIEWTQSTAVQFNASTITTLAFQPHLNRKYVDPPHAWKIS